MVAGLQSAFERGFLAGGQTVKGLVQTVEHGRGAEFVAHAFLGVDHFAVDLGGQVDVGVVALGGRTVDAHEGAETLTQGFQTLVDVLIGDLGLGDLELHAVKLRQLDVGATLDGRRELQLGVVLGGLRNGLHVELRLGHRVDLLGLKSLGVQLRHALVHGLAGDGAEADALVDDLAGHVALAEAGHVDLLGDFLAGFVEIRVELLRIDGDGELHLGRLKIPDADFHACAPETIRFFIVLPLKATSI